MVLARSTGEAGLLVWLIMKGRMDQSIIRWLF